MVQVLDHALGGRDDVKGEVIINLNQFSFRSEPVLTAWYQLNMEVNMTWVKIEPILAHLSWRLVGELIVYQWSGVRPLSTISSMNISATSGQIATKFYLKHHWVEGKAALGFWPDPIRTLDSMATESSHRVIMEKTVFPLFRLFFT